MISPITGDENLDAFLYKLNEDVLLVSATASSAIFTSPAAFALDVRQADRR